MTTCNSRIEGVLIEYRYSEVNCVREIEEFDSLTSKNHRSFLLLEYFPEIN